MPMTLHAADAINSSLVAFIYFSTSNFSIAERHQPDPSADPTRSYLLTLIDCCQLSPLSGHFLPQKLDTMMSAISLAGAPGDWVIPAGIFKSLAPAANAIS
jgi:hypothetical protein